jgi:hypothetical protein
MFDSEEEFPLSETGWIKMKLEVYERLLGKAKAFDDLRDANQKAKDRCQELILESNNRLDSVLYILDALENDDVS